MFAVKLQVTNGRVIIGYGYASLIYGAAQIYDTQFSTIINFKGQKHTIYRHEIISQENNDKCEHHTSTDIQDLTINYTNLDVGNKNNKN